MDRLCVSFDEETCRTISKVAAAEGISQSKLVNRFVRQGLALDAPSDQAAVLLQMVKTAVKEENRPLRRLAYIGAREAARSAFWARQADAHLVADIVPGTTALHEAMDLLGDEALKAAVKLLRSKEIERKDLQAVEAAEAEAAVLEVPADQAEPFLGGDDDAADFDTEEPAEPDDEQGPEP